MFSLNLPKIYVFVIVFHTIIVYVVFRKYIINVCLKRFALLYIHLVSCRYKDSLFISIQKEHYLL